jgi:molybdopterin-guanine dinucleotide biosynthesis protein B
LRTLGIVGWSGSGKTTLLIKVIPHLRAGGLTVSTVKHAHHGFDMDRPGKDTYRHREAGAHEVMVATARRWALLHEMDGPEPTLPTLLARMAPVDIVLVEGFKTHEFPKLEVHRPALGKPPIWPDWPDVAAVATDAALSDCPRTVLPLNDPVAIADWIVAFLGFHPARDLNPAASHGPDADREVVGPEVAPPMVASPKVANP